MQLIAKYEVQEMSVLIYPLLPTPAYTPAYTPGVTPGVDAGVAVYSAYTPGVDAGVTVTWIST